jgi:hypothetical protein
MPTHPEVTLRDTYLFSLKKDWFMGCYFKDTPEIQVVL